jgi:hypothetical protein
VEVVNTIKEDQSKIARKRSTETKKSPGGWMRRGVSTSKRIKRRYGSCERHRRFGPILGGFRNEAKQTPPEKENETR